MPKAKKRPSGKKKGTRKKRTGVVIRAVVLPKDAAKKAEVLFEILCEQDPTKVTLRQALDAVSLRTGVPYDTLKRYPGKYGWNIKWKTFHEKKGSTLTAVEVNTALQVIRERGEFDPNVPFTKIAGELKGLAYLVVSTNREMVETSATMIRFYRDKAEDVMERCRKAGIPMRSMSKTDLGLIETYMAKAREYYVLVKDYMQPSALMAMLDQLSMRDAVGLMPDGMEQTAFTPASLLKKMEDLALTSKGVFLSAVRNPDLIKDVEAEIINDMGDNVPEVDGHKVRDEENAINLDKPKGYGDDK